MERKQLVVGRGSREKLREGVWRIRHNLGIDPETGKYRYSPWRNVYTTRKSEVTTALEEYKRELNEGLLDKDTNITVGEYAQKFHALRANSGMSPLSYNREGIDIKKICGLFGKIKLVNLKPLTIKEAYAKIREEKSMSESTLHNVHIKLRQILDEAIDDEIIDKNPCAKISVPRPKAKERDFLCEEEAARLLTCIETAPLDSRVIGVYIMLMTGMRRGEVLGLTWRHISFDPAQIYVAQQYTNDKDLRSPKTEKGKRHIGLEPDTVNYLLKWKSIQAELLAELGLHQEPDTPVIHRIINADDSTKLKTGNAVKCGFTDPANFSTWFRLFSCENGFGEFKVEERFYNVKIYEKNRTRRAKLSVDEYRELKASGARIEFIKTTVQRTGYTGLTPHMLRHTHATLLISAGVNLKTVQTRLGHAQITTTVDIYSHAIAAKDTEAAAAFNGVITHRSIEEIAATLIQTEQLNTIPQTDQEIQEIMEESGPRNGEEASAAIRKFALAQKKEFTKRQAMEACHITSQKWMSNALVHLQREGIIEKLGTSKDVRYKLRC